MVDPCGKWQCVYESARRELDPQRRQELCDQARRLIQDRLIQIQAGVATPTEQGILESALRQLWNMEHEPTARPN